MTIFKSLFISRVGINIFLLKNEWVSKPLFNTLS